MQRRDGSSAGVAVQLRSYARSACRKLRERERSREGRCSQLVCACCLFEVTLRISGEILLQRKRLETERKTQHNTKRASNQRFTGNIQQEEDKIQ